MVLIDLGLHDMVQILFVREHEEVLDRIWDHRYIIIHA